MKKIGTSCYEKLPVVCTLHKVIYDPDGRIIDFELLDANSRFFHVFKLEKNSIQGRLLSEWLFDSQNLPDFWRRELSVAATSPDLIEIDLVLKSDAKWLRLHGYAPKEGYLIIYFQKSIRFHQSRRQFSKRMTVVRACLEESQQFAQMIFDYTPSCIIVYEVQNEGATGMDYIIKEINNAGLKVEGWELQTVINQPIKKVRPAVENFGIIPVFQRVWKTGIPEHYPAKVYQDEVDYRWFENFVFKLPTGEIVAIYDDITPTKRKEEQLLFLSRQDTLTGLFNRSYFQEVFTHLDQEINYPLTLIMGDLDGLKLINDAFGQETGDEALVAVAKILQANCGERGVVSRWGGDEFLILLPNTPRSIGQNTCENIKAQVALTKVKGTELQISLGCATKTQAKESFAELLREAENNMYKAKLLGAKSYRNVVLSSIERTLFEKSDETEEHGRRLGKYCRLIGKALGLDTSLLDELEVFSMLHDIGKIGIDEQILNKAGPLSEEEWEIMKTHPEIGYRIAHTVPELVNIADYILAHHERWDGQGYPHGLEGEAIPLQARILAVVDAYDAMTSDRVYRKALSKDIAIKELKTNSGSQFDPTVVELFCDFFEAGQID